MMNSVHIWRHPLPRKKTNLNLKADLLKSMRSLLKKEGLDGLDVRKIVVEGGCSVGTFYNHYKSLDELIISFNGVTLDMLTISIFEDITPKDSAREIISKICSNYIQFAENNHSEWLLLLEYPLKTDLPDWYTEKSEILFQKAAATFHPLLRGKKKDSERAVKILWSGLHGICSLTLKQKLRFKKEHNALELSQELFHNYILGHRIGDGIT